jgi:hypothetical protein
MDSSNLGPGETHLSNIDEDEEVCCSSGEWTDYIFESKVVLFYTQITEQIGEGRGERRAHCEKRLSFFPSPAGMSQTNPWPGIIKLFPTNGRVWLVTSRLGTGKTINFFSQCGFTPLTCCVG